MGLTPAHACSYHPEQEARSLVVLEDTLLNPESYEKLLEYGFRRSGGLAYRPWCDQCRRCIPARIPVAAFRANRSQRRALKVNQDVQMSLCDSQLSDEQYALYQRYQQRRHAHGDMASSTKNQAQEFLSTVWNTVKYIEFRQASRLLAVAVTDVHANSLSAVYTFFDPELDKRSLGVFAVLQQIEMARQWGLDWVYLGYWIPDSRKMAYKANFLPIEVKPPRRELEEEQWIRLTDKAHRQKFLDEFVG